jgi:hypothetical protein
VTWIRETAPGASDPEVLEVSHRESRILLTQDWDFGELAVRDRKPTAGIVIVPTDAYAGPLDTVAAQIAQRLIELGGALGGHLTVVGPRRTRQRVLTPADDPSGIDDG